MQARSPHATEVPTTSPPPLPVPPRWHLRTQVSRKTLFDLIQDTLPVQGLQVTSGQDGVAIATAATPEGPAPATHGVVPQAYLDSLAATVPMSVNPATLWSDGDTTPDIPEHWRPITITLASTPALQPPVLPPPAQAQHPLRGVARTAGWMLSGAALTFLVAAAAFGGKPMLRAIRTVMAPQTQAPVEGPVEGPLPATQTAPAPLPLPARAPAPPVPDLPSGTVVALAERPGGASHPVSSAAAADHMPGARQDVENGADAGKGAAVARGAHRARPERRLVKSPPLADDAETSVPGGGDAVMPLASTQGDARETPAARSNGKTAPALSRSNGSAKAPSIVAGTSGSRAFRPIDVEDPFGGR